MGYLKKNLAIAAFLCLAIPGFSQVDTTFHIFLMFGQSNMEGQGTVDPSDQVTNDRVWMLQDSTCPNLNRSYGQWYLATPPLNRCWGKLGPGDSFGRMMGEQAPDYVTRIGLVNVSVAGCNIFIYKKGCPNGLDEISQGIPFNCGYAWLLDLARKAQQKGVIKGILFHQGETNNTDTTWKYTVKQIVTDLETDLGLGDIPFLAGELLYGEYNGCCSAHNVEINKLPYIIPNAHVISAKGLPGADYAHFTSDSYRAFGRRYARKMLELLYGICDSAVITPGYYITKGSLATGPKVVIGHGASVTLSPQPSNELGTWKWEGNGISGTSREKKITINKDTTDVRVTYTNECGAKSRMSYRIIACDTTHTELWYQINRDSLMQSSNVLVRKGSTLLLSPVAADTVGSWTWSGAGLSGTSREQSMTVNTLGTYTAVAAFTNGCGAKSRLQITITVCDSTKISSWYRVGNGDLTKGKAITVKQGSVLKLMPEPANETGTWKWTGAVEGSDRVQMLNTDAAGTYTAYLAYTNPCGILSRLTVTVVVEAVATGNPDIARDHQVTLFPNPAGNKLTIRWNNSSGLNVREAFITNVSGQIVKQVHIANGNGESTIDVSSLSNGIYFLNLSTNEGTLVKKFTRLTGSK
jgi:hypothetical protein